ncbi:MAG: YqeG family HAD IIIA-type phosphatase [Armatimonadota bacterium]
MIKRLLWMCRPNELVCRITEIDIQRLFNAGFRSLLLDLDNTLLPWRSFEVPTDVRCWLRAAEQLGFKLCIVSNTHDPGRLRMIAEEVGVEYVHRALKPCSAGFDMALAKLGCTRREAVVVGDQVLTDVLGGNLAGMYTILVEPMHPAEFFGTKISRLIERVIGRQSRGNKGWVNSVRKEDTR